jgi:hypothetical protein
MQNIHDQENVAYVFSTWELVGYGHLDRRMS